MEPRIQYAKTSDGVNIAFDTQGAGVPIVYAPSAPVANMQLDWEIPDMMPFLELMAQKHMVVRYDNRGAGLSGGDVADLDLDTYLLDLESVADRLGLDSFVLFAPSMSGPMAIAYAARNPGRISHLILFNSGARGAEFIGSPRDRALGALMEADWEMYTETAAHLTYGWSAGEPARRMAARLRESQTPQKLKLAYRALAMIDTTSLMSQVECPTLVLHRRQASFPSISASRSLTAGIPDARLTLLEGRSTAPWMDDSAAVITAISQFLGDGDAEAGAGAERPQPSAFRTVLFTDVEGSTALTDRLGDARARDLLREHERLTREALTQHGGAEIKTMGDGFMTSFSSATKAIECAVAMQQSFTGHNESADEPIKIRIGLNAGEPIEENEDLFGTAVNIAARIAAKANGGEILTSNVVRELVAGKGFLFNDRGEISLRGVEDPVRVYEMLWRE